ncbi:MAG: hypothetical protein HY243_14980 [Proteobacteria bacterium]|nr:hypothetical protein [Pseudomonadota bacterium]
MTLLSRFLRVHMLALFVLLVLAVLLLHPIAAYAAAAATSDTTANFTTIIDYFFQILAAVLLGLVTWAVKRYSASLGFQLDDQQRVFLDQAIQNGVAWAVKTADAAAQAKFGKVDVKDPRIALVATYLSEHAPDALKKLGLTDEQIERKIIAKLPA